MVRQNSGRPPDLIGARGAGLPGPALSQSNIVGNAEINNSEPGDWQDAAKIARVKYLCRRYFLKPAVAGVYAELLAAADAGR